MRSDFIPNMEFANKYMPPVIEILRANAMHLLRVEIASQQVDLQQATDLIVTVQGGDVAVRVRRAGIYDKYGDFTLRAYNNGYKTEIHKIRDGFAKWYLYAWEGDNGKIEHWILVDLDVMRTTSLLDDSYIIPRIKMNPDGETGFVSYSIGTLTVNQCVVAAKL